jgi:hypothetical protein
MDSMFNTLLLRFVSTTVVVSVLPTWVEAKLTVLGLTSSRRAAADDVPFAETELQPDNNKLSKITEAHKQCVRIMPLRGLPGNIFLKGVAIIIVSKWVHERRRAKN